MRVLHEEEQLALGLGVEEQGPAGDVGRGSDLLCRDVLDAVLGEQLAGSRGDSSSLGCLFCSRRPTGWEARSLEPPGRYSDCTQMRV